MSNDKGITWYDKPREMWLHPTYGWPNQFTVYGETSRSWVMRPKSWRKPVKRLKKENPEVHEDYARRFLWVQSHRGHVGSTVGRCDDYDLLRKIADLIGYKEQP